MSWFRFLASDKPLIDVENQYAEFMSINTALAKGRKVPDFLLNNPKVDRDNEKMILVFDTKEHMDEIEIREECKPSSAFQYTQKKYASGLIWRYTEKRAEQLMDYIKEHLKYSKEIELWDTWHYEKEIPTIRYILLQDLTLKDIKEIYGKEFYYTPECVVVRQQ